MGEYEDIEWLRQLHAELWPQKQERRGVKLKAKRELTKAE